MYNMHELGKQAVLVTNEWDRADAWRGLTKAQAREWIDGAAEADGKDYPVTPTALKAFQQGVREALQKKKNPRRRKRR